MPEPPDNSESIFLILGGGSGIGAAIARRCAERGRVLITHKRPDEDLARTTARLGGRLAGVCVGDLTSARVRDEAVDLVRPFATRLRGVVLSVGDYPRTDPRRLTWQHLREGIDTNALSQLDVLLRVVHGLDVRDASIVMISSALVGLEHPELIPYLAAKSVLETALRNLTRPWGALGNRVNIVRAGSIFVGEHRGVGSDPAAVSAQLARQAVARRGQPDDVAACVVFLLRPEQGFITGQTIGVDGGWHVA